MCDVDRRAHDGIAIGRTEPLDEAAVDLHLRDRQPVQLRQRRIAGAEVVEGDLHPEPAHLRQGAHVLVDLRHHQALRDLERQALRRDVVLAEPARHQVRESRICEVANGHVHGGVERHALLAPGAAVVERAPQHLLGEGFDQAGVLRERDEARRRDRSAGGVIPARQGLEAARQSRPDVDARLEREPEPVAREQVAEVGEELHPLGPARVLARVVHHDAAADPRGVAGGDVREAQERGRVAAVLRPHGDPEVR